MSEILKELVLRPNLQNQGTLPELGECLDKCPDILCAGDEPIADFQKELATEESYSSEFKDKYVPGHINYIYIRVKNNSEEDLNDVYAELFYCDADHVSFVSNWKRVPIENRESSSGGNSFDVIKTNEIGVVEAPFMLPPNLGAIGEFCLIARIWSDSEKYSNPITKKIRPVYMRELIAEHLLWGQKNIFVTNTDVKAFACASANLLISDKPNPKNTENKYALILNTTNVACNNIEIEIRNSRTDDNGKIISFPKTIIKSDTEIIGEFTLKEGYNSQMTIYIYRPAGQRPSSDENYEVNAYEKIKSSNKNINQSADKIKSSRFSCISTFTFNTEF